MKNREIEERLASAMSHAAPDKLDSILSSCEEQKGAEINMTKKTEKNILSFNKVWAVVALAAVLLLSVAGFALTNRSRSISDPDTEVVTQVAAVVLLDVNPSISLSVDAAEQVLAVEALNEDAVIILGDMDLTGTSLDVAINAIIGSMLQNGYLSDLQNTVLVTVEDADEATSAALQEKIADAIAAVFSSNDTESTVTSAILTQSVTSDDDALNALAEEYGISLGKAALIQEVIAQDETLSFTDLASLSITEIALIASTRSLSETTVSQTGSASTKSYIGEDAALEVALNHAGVSSSQISQLKVEFDSEDGIMVYEVDFNVGTTEYEYEINASTGEMVKYEVEEKGSSASSGASGNTSSGTVSGSTDNSENSSSADNTTSTASGTTYIGKEAAKTAALNHAGYTEEETTYIHCYVEYDDGRAEYYEVEFKVGKVTYEYEIDLYSGQILSYSSESHQDNTSTSSSGTAYIGEDAAKTAALNHAGYTEAETTYIHCYVEYDDGRAEYYEVEFTVGQVTYEYEIDLYSGQILSYSSESHQNSTTSSGSSQTASSESSSGSSQSGSSGTDSYISADAATSIALSHVGLSESEVSKLKCELDHEDGTVIYEIEFNYGQYEYEFEINAVTGAILKYEIDD